MEGFVNYEKGEVVIFRFPFSDRGEVKKRPSLVVAKLKGSCNFITNYKSTKT